MEWNNQQNMALTRVQSWLESRDQSTFFLAGFAGTGKTTLAKHFAQHVSGTVLFASLTGKAASVMRRRGCLGATTLHSLLYVVAPKGQQYLNDLLDQLTRRRADEIDFVGSKAERYLLRLIDEEKKAVRRPSFTLNPNSPLAQASLLVIDEASMADSRIVDDVLSFGVPVLALGDPAQLPPVMGVGYFTKGEPDFLLTEVVRQARDNPIIELATRVRNQQSLVPGKYGDSEVVSLANFDKKETEPTTQIIVGKNETRRRANKFMRTKLGRESDLPCAGDKLVCLRNDHEVGLLNGSIWNTVDALALDDGILSMIVDSEDDSAVRLVVDAHEAPFKGEDVELCIRKEAQEFDFGYCLTAHKAQGSEWKDVLVVDEGRVFNQDRWRWLYTAVTRASEKVKVVV